LARRKPMWHEKAPFRHHAEIMKRVDYLI
jgi:hypothetical protein